MIERSAGESDGVKNEDAGRAQCLRSDDVLFALQQHAAADKRNPGEKSDRDSQLWRNQVVLERIFYEKGNAKEQGEPADPREHFRAHELFPIDFARRRCTGFKTHFFNRRRRFHLRYRRNYRDRQRWRN